VLNSNNKNNLLVCISCDGKVNIWNVLQCKKLLNVSLKPISDALSQGLLNAEVNDQGAVTVITASGDAFVYDQSFGSWLRIADRRYQLSEFNSTMFDSWMAKQGPLLRIQLMASSPSLHLRTNTNIASQMLAMHDKDRITETLSHLENQIAASIAMGSASEYKRWMETYVRKLTQEAKVDKLTEICEQLLGPAHYRPINTHPDSSVPPFVQPNWQPTVLDIPKRSLLESLLLVISENRALQRVAIRFQEALEQLSQQEAQESINTQEKSTN